MDAERSHVQAKLDSLTHLQLPAGKLSRKLDSLTRAKEELTSGVTKKIEDLKSKVTGQLKQIDLPQEWKEPMNELQQSIREYSLSPLNSSVSLGKLNNLQLPTFSSKLNNYATLNDVTDQFGRINTLTDQAGDYAQDARNLVKGNLSDLNSIDNTFESKLSDVEGIGQLREGNEFLSRAATMDSAAMMDKAQEMAKEQLMNAAQDHFAGKEALLQQAMDKMSKLKNKYSEVQDMAALPKRLPNPLKGKPLIERLVPSIGYQIQKPGSFLFDVSPLMMYRFTPRISLGAGWNQRFAIEDSQLQQNESIYGPRVAIEVKWARGFNVRLLPEIMNTTIPPLIAQTMGVDAAYREWIPSLFVGMKKDFNIYKQIRGYTEILYNLYDPDGMSPYGDKLSVRFGFEFPMKKKTY